MENLCPDRCKLAFLSAEVKVLEMGMQVMFRTGSAFPAACTDMYRSLECVPFISITKCFSEAEFSLADSAFPYEGV